VKAVEKQGRTIEEAVDAALTELETTKDRVDVHIVEEAKKGFLGIIGSKPAVVHVEMKPDPFEIAEAFLKSVTEEMGISVQIEVKTNGDEIEFELSGEKIAVLIGKRGNTLNALEYLTNLAVNRKTDEFVRIVFDAENYRARRSETLKQLAFRLSEKAEKTGKKVPLDPMPSMERKVIHMSLKKRNGIETYSEGKDPHRRVVIKPS
jgi:spoIIIJ-associated protein